MKRYEAEMRHEIGLDKLMWGADYPHLEGAAPVHRETLRYIFGGIPEDELRQILGGNAVYVVGLRRCTAAGGGRPGGSDGRGPGDPAGAGRHRGHLQLEPGPAGAARGPGVLGRTGTAEANLSPARTGFAHGIMALCLITGLAGVSCAETVSTATVATAATAASATTRAGSVVGLLTLPKPVRDNVVLTSVSCVDPTYCIAVGVSVGPADTGGAPGYWPIGLPVALRFNGRTWSSIASPSGSPVGLNGVSCVARADCVAVGEQTNASGDESTLVEKYSGTGWKVVPSADAALFPRNSSFLESVSCRSVGSCVAAGGDYDVSAGRADRYAPLLESPSASGWTLTPLASPTTGSFTSVSCSAGRGHCVVVGTGTAADQETNGSWVPIASSMFALQGVSCSADAACTAVGQPLQGAGLSLATLAGTEWKDVAAPEGPKWPRPTR